LSEFTADEITFYVPARNAEAWLTTCLDAITHQTCSPREVLVIVDTASQDATADIAREIPGVRLLKQHGLPLGQIRNLAISEASTDWIASCDVDVILCDIWLETLSARISTGAAVIGGRIDENVRTPFDHWRAINLPHHWGNTTFANPYMLTSTGLFDRRALLAVGGYKDELYFHEDSELCGRLRDAGYGLFYDPAARGQHQRTDTLTSVLTLRWNYAHYRQSHHFDSLAGLARKTTVNRDYALGTLGKVLTTSTEHLSYVSFLLFYHHAVHDLRELMRRRSLVPTAERQLCEQQLVGRIMAALGQVDDRLANLVAEDLTGLPAEPVVAGPMLSSPPNWREYLEAMERAAADFADELDHGLRALIETSGEFLHERARREQIPAPPAADPERVGAILNRLAPRAVLDEATPERWRKRLGGTAELFIAGPVAESDLAQLDRTFNVRAGSFDDLDASSDATVALLHLESDAQPLARLQSVADQARRLVVTYTPPALFIPMLEPLRPLDLVSTLVAAGHEILGLETSVGTTTLITRRREDLTVATARRKPALAVSA
jgi:glycosyltransferase involved in cell wall biosynthesis